jgi:putative GTP pyrophosphokinase
MLVINWREFLQPYIQAVSELELKFRNLANQYTELNKHCPIELISGRVKSVNSILGKANRKNIPLSEIGDRIEDIAGIRIICQFVEDIERIIEIIKSREDFDMIILKERDYVTNTKPSGYRSYHIIISYPIAMVTGVKNIKAEIQIRTMSMDFWATIEHSMRYKYNGDIPAHVQERLTSSAEAAFKLDKEMSLIRDEIMEAQKITRIIAETVDEIMSNLSKLHSAAKFDIVNDLHKEFMEVYQLNSVERLLQFAEQVRIVADMYKVRFN